MLTIKLPDDKINEESTPAASEKSRVRVPYKTLAITSSAALVLSLTTGGIYAFLSAHDSSTNAFTVAENYHINEIEPLYSARAQASDAIAVQLSDGVSYITVPNDAYSIQPGQTIVRDPYVENLSDVKSYIFAEVDVPVLSVETSTSGGAVVSTPLFSYTLNDGWEKIDASDSEDDGKVVYAYNDTLTSERTTTPVFSNLTYADVTSPGIRGGDYITEVEITAYGVQAETFSAAADAWNAYISISGKTPRITEKIAEWSDGVVAKFTSDTSESAFDKVLIDGVVVDDTDYTLSGDNDSTSVTFNNDYMKTLEQGTHTVTIVSSDGAAKTKFSKRGQAALSPENVATVNGMIDDAISAMNHNCFYRGKDITAAYLDGTMSANIRNGSFEDIYPGDYFYQTITWDGVTYENTKWLVAECDPYMNRGDTAVTQHHIGIIPDSLIGKYRMAATNTTASGFQSSEMWTTTIPKLVIGLKNAFGEAHLIKFRALLTNATDANKYNAGYGTTFAASGWSWVDAWCVLMSNTQVFGFAGFDSSGYDAGEGCTQLACFRHNPQLTTFNRNWFWLRGVTNSTYFADSGYGGSADYNASNADGAVRPLFLYH